MGIKVYLPYCHINTYSQCGTLLLDTEQYIQLHPYICVADGHKRFCHTATSVHTVNGKASSSGTEQQIRVCVIIYSR